MKYDDFVHAGGRETQVKVSRSFILKLSGNTRLKRCENGGITCTVIFVEFKVGCITVYERDSDYFFSN